MTDRNLFETQRDVGPAVVSALRAAGFDDALEIGRGGFGIVYRCTQLALDRTVAVKVLTTDLDENRERFLRCLLYTSPSPRDLSTSRMPSSA